ncbi:MAG TPA: hypothetical protein VGO09_05115, partial [Flavisolibacter sp.]|nr:hypothetical protein [Flavisolibacter sp.]
MLSALSQKFSSFISYLTGRYAPAFITIILLGAGFFFYFNVIVSGNESDIKSRNFRGLQRMAYNISQKIENYSEKNVQNFIKFTKNVEKPKLKFLE